MYADNFISMVSGNTQVELLHVGRDILFAIHSVFLEDTNAEMDPISIKKWKQGDGIFECTKTLLGCQFDGMCYTIWLDHDKQTKLVEDILRCLVHPIGVPFQSLK